MSTPSNLPSPRRLLANRANAQLATGPKTLAGKRVASQNAIRHRLSVPLADDVMSPLRAEVASFLMESDVAPDSANDLAEKIIEFERNMAVFRQVEGNRLAGLHDAPTPVTPLPEGHFISPYLVKLHAKQQEEQEHRAIIDFERYLRRARNQLIKGLRELSFLQNEPNGDTSTREAFNA